MILELLLYLFILIASFYILLKSADYLISSSSEIGKRLGISKFVIGLTIVAIGTSLPELFTTVMAIYTSSDPAPFVLGTVIGSNISNILLVFAIYLLYTRTYKKEVKLFDTIFLIIATATMLYMIYRETIGIPEGLLMLLIFILYIFYSIKKNKKKDIIHEAEEVTEDKISSYSHFFVTIILILSLLGLGLSSRGVIFSIENTGMILNIPIELLTLTTVAFATSLPEIVVTYQSCRRNEGEMAVGNILGSNISNIFLITGISALLTELVFNFESYIIGSIFLMISTIAFIFLSYRKKTKKYHGVLLIIIYIIYLYFLFFN